MKKTAIFLALICLASSFPMPPIGDVTSSPRGKEFSDSLGSTMVRPQSVSSLVVPATGFRITNIVVTSSSVSLAWQEGTPPFYVWGAQKVDGGWSLITTADVRSVTLSLSTNRFFRLGPKFFSYSFETRQK